MIEPTEHQEPSREDPADPGRGEVRASAGSLSQTERFNQQFYDALYRGHGSVRHLIRAYLSFDQRSKAGPNLEMLRPLLRDMSSWRRSTTGRATGSPSKRAPGRRRLRVLDYGCGWGTFLLRLARRADVELFGYDLAPASVPGVDRAARLMGGRVKEAPRASDGALREAWFDIVVCSHVLEHVPDDRALLRDLRRSLAAGGHLLLNVPVNEVWEDPRHVRRYDAGSLEALIRSNGLTVTQQRVVDRWTALLLLRAQGTGPIGSFGLRLLRGVLTLFPWHSVNALGEYLLAPDYPRQQLLMLCQREED